MLLSRLIFLGFRYATLTFVGMSIAWLWQICRLGQYAVWGKFYALWFPLLYGVVSTLYVMVAECASRREHGNRDEGCQRIFYRFRNYDDYTYFLLLWIIVLEIAGVAVKDVYFWLSISYIGSIVLKGGVFFIYLYQVFSQCLLQKNPADSSHQSDSQINHIGRGISLPLRLQWPLVLAILGVYLLLSAYHIRRASLTGDEPHYLLITHSLWHDHDTDLRNNYEQRDYAAFFWYELRPSWGDEVKDPTTGAMRIYSYRHKGGFPYTLIPGYVLGGQFGAVVLMNLVTALLMLQVFLLSYELFHSFSASFFTWLWVGLTIPVIIYMGQLYPDTLAALLTLWGVRRIRRLQSEQSLRSKHFWLNGLCIAGTLLLLVLLKTRYIPLAGTLVLLLFLSLFRGRLPGGYKAGLAVGLVGLVVCGAALAYIADAVLFDHMYRDRLTDTKYMTWMLSGYNPLFGFFGLLFDQEYGILPYTPLYIVALIGAGLLTKQEFKDAWPILGVCVLNYAAISGWSLWHSAPTPPSRYILPVLALLGVFSARFFGQPDGIIKGMVFGLGSVWSALTAWIVTLTPKWRYNWADGANNFLESLSLRLSVDLTRLSPSWIRLSPLTPSITVVGIAGLVLLISLCRRHATNSRKTTQTISSEFQVILAVTLFLACMTSGVIIGKKLPTRVLEAEDLLAIRAHGGERVPPTPDPWVNQDYQRFWKYHGWKLFPGNSLETRPQLIPGKVKLTIYARAAIQTQEPVTVPVMLVLINDVEIGRVPVSSTGWDRYTFPVTVNENRPRIAIKNEYRSEEAKSALIIDKLRFE